MTQENQERGVPRARSVFSPRGTMGRLIFAWLWVGIPLAVGVALTVHSSIPLFTSAPPAVTLPASGK